MDASRSTGDGLTYLLEFGDGTTSTQPIATHGGAVSQGLTARLTVTDRFSRVDSTTRDYFLALVENYNCCSTSWNYTLINMPHRPAAADRADTDLSNLRD